MIDSIRRSMRRLNYRLLMSLILLGLIPTIYTTVRVFLIGQLPDDWGFNIASQLAWVHLLYEVLQEAIILPLFYFIGKAIYDRIDLTNKVRTGLIFTGTIYVALSMLIIVFAEPIIRFMAQEVELIDATATYVRLETVAEIFSMLVRFLLVVIVVIDKDRYIYYVLGLRMVLTIVLDVFLVSTLSFSLSLGVNGIAITNIIVNILMLVLAYGILKREHVFLFAKQKLSFGWIKELSRVGGISGLESLIRNLAFMLMIIRMVNVVGEQGTFWVANNFIWGWLLLPVLQLGELIKRDCGEDENAIKEKSLGYFAVTAIIVLLWALTLPLWIPFFRDVLRLDHYQDVFDVVLISVGFYVLFAFNNVIDSIFYGIGKISYMLFQSVVINSVFYGTAFVLYLTGIYQPTLTSIALMFAMGIAFDSLLTFGMYVWMLKKRNIDLFAEEIVLEMAG